jgi:hypothetical protein
MLRVQKPPAPPGYSKCGQTVTVYHFNPETHTVYRTVIARAFLEQRRSHELGKTGSSEESGFLLVIPQAAGCAYVPPEGYTGMEGTYSLANLDKVLPGAGPDVTADDWGAFIPAKVPGLCVVNQIALKHWEGVICHLEAS